MQPEKMTITSCSMKENGDILQEGGKFEVLVNPTSFFHEHSISYSKDKTIGISGEELKFGRTNAEKVSFEIVLDGTGVAEASEQVIPVKDRIKQLKDIIYEYDGKEHQPKPVNLRWGTFSFNCRLASLSLEYTMFASNGSPLRAKVKLAFSQYMSKQEQAARENKSSPDLTHTIVVKAGDMLPLLCYQVYKDAAYYTEVARINGLNSLQKLQPGLRLKFPPLR